MITKKDYVKKSLKLNLFFLRVLKEHAVFIEASFTPKNHNLAMEADKFKIDFEALLEETIYLSRGKINIREAENEFVTTFTLNAEKVTQLYTGIPINSNITIAELNLTQSRDFDVDNAMEQNIRRLNNKILIIGNRFAQFKQMVYSEVNLCRIVTSEYPTFFHHVLQEIEHYLKDLRNLQNYEDIQMPDELTEHEEFWNHIMGEHAQFIRGKLDPSEEKLIDTADYFAKEFKELEEKAAEAVKSFERLEEITKESLKETTELRNFKATGLKGALECKVKTIAPPLLLDHVLREANHYINMLKKA